MHSYLKWLYEYTAGVGTAATRFEILNCKKYCIISHDKRCRYKVPNIKVPNHKIPNNKVPNNEIPK